MTLPPLPLLSTLVGLVAVLANPAAAAAQAPSSDSAGVALTGMVEDTFGDDGFVIDFGEGTVAVATGDLYEQNPTFRLNVGETVTVFGEGDADLYDQRIIDADAVYVAGRDMIARTSEPLSAVLFRGTHTPNSGRIPATLSVEGVVGRVDGRRFMLRVGNESLSVDAAALGYDPFDDIGQPRIGAGDVVVVTGPLGAAALADRQLRAERLMVVASERRTPGDGAAARTTDQNTSRSSRPEGRAAMVEEPTGTSGPDRKSATSTDDGAPFERYDRNGDGVLTQDEYARVAARPENVTRAEAARLFDALARGDRLVTRREFDNPNRRYERLAERVRRTSQDDG